MNLDVGNCAKTAGEILNRGGKAHKLTARENCSEGLFALVLVSACRRTAWGGKNTNELSRLWVSVQECMFSHGTLVLAQNHLAVGARQSVLGAEE